MQAMPVQSIEVKAWMIRIICIATDNLTNPLRKMCCTNDTNNLAFTVTYTRYFAVTTHLQMP